MAERGAFVRCATICVSDAHASAELALAIESLDWVANVIANDWARARAIDAGIVIGDSSDYMGDCCPYLRLDVQGSKLLSGLRRAPDEAGWTWEATLSSGQERDSSQIAPVILGDQSGGKGIAPGLRRFLAVVEAEWWRAVRATGGLPPHAKGLARVGGLDRAAWGLAGRPTSGLLPEPEVWGVVPPSPPADGVAAEESLRSRLADLRRYLPPAGVAPPPPRLAPVERAGAPRLFVSYRRADNPFAAGRVRDELAKHFGESDVFFDVDSIPLGADFRDVIRGFIAGVTGMVVVIGRDWQPERLADPTDFVRMELVEARSQGKLIVPVLLDDASPPGPEVLPSELGWFAFLNAAKVASDNRFSGDVGRIARAIQRAHEA